MKIDRKINLFFTAIIVMLSILLAVSFISFEYNQLNKSMNERGQIIIDDLAANLEFPLFIRNLEEVKKIIDKASIRDGVVYCVLVDNGGNTIYFEGNDKEKSVKIYKKTVLKRSSMGQGEEMVLGIESETIEPLGLLSLSLSTIETQKAVSFMLMMTVTITLFAILMASVISGFLIKRMLGEPIGLLVKSTQQIARGDFSHKVPIESKDEIGMLAGAFNDMTFKLSISLVSKDYMKSIFASMAETLLVTNADGNIEMVNDAAVKMLGMKREELSGKPVTAFFDGVTLLDAGTGLLHVEKTCLSAKGRVPVLFGTSALLDKNGQTTGYSCVAVDISKLKEAERKLLDAMEKIADYNDELTKTTEKLKELDKMKSDFLSMVSHELRTPVTSIKGYLSFLMKGLGGSISPNQMDFLESISRNTERLLRLINDLLDMTKIEVGTFAVNRIQSDIIRIMNNSINEMGPLLESKKAVVERGFGSNVMDLCVDEYRLSQVFINILNNAIKFTGNNSKITVDIKIAAPGTVDVPEFTGFKPLKTKEYCCITVKDEGVGIEKEYIEMIFERFYQVEDLNTRKYQGLGLGLNITKNIVTAHEGTIWASSEGKGKGTTINILLPAKEC